MKRIISLIMVLVLALSLVPTTVWATEAASADDVYHVDSDAAPNDNQDSNGIVTYAQNETPVEVWAGYSGNSENNKVQAYATIDAAVENLGSYKWLLINGDYTIEKDFTIPAGVYLDVANGATLTVANGATLTVAQDSARLRVLAGGTIANNGKIMVCGTKPAANGAAYKFAGGTLTGNELSVPDGYILDVNKSGDNVNYFASKALFEITFDDNTKLLTADSSNAKNNVKEIKLLDNITDRGWTIDEGMGSDITLDLNGFTYGGNGENPQYSTLNISNTKVTIKNGTVKYSGSVRGAIELYGSADLTIDSTAVIDGGNTFGILTSGTSKLTVNGTVKSNGDYAIAGNGSKDSGGYIDNCDIIVNTGAVVSAPNGFAIYHPELGTVTINGGEISGHNGVEMCAGKLTVQDGNISSTGDNWDATGSQNAIKDGAAVSIINRNYPGGVPTAEIAGGTFTATGSGALAIKAYDYTGNTVAEWTDVKNSVSITGGTFSSNPTKFVDTGKYTVTEENGKFTVNEREYVAQVGENKYYTLGEAVASIADKGTVTLLKDVTLDNSVTINASKEVTIDGQGNTINVSDGKYIKASENGKLTLSVTVTGPAYEMSLLCITGSAEVTISKDSKVAATSVPQGYPAILIQSNKESITTYTPQLHVYGAVSAVKMPAIQGNGTDRSTSKIDINDGASVTSDSLAMYLPQPCEVNVNGGTVKGYCAIGIKSGTLNINGGLVQGVANDTKISDDYSTTNGINYDGSAIMIDSYIGYAGQVKINISGGKVESLHSTAIREIGNDESKTNMVSLSVTGGEVMGADGMDAILVRDVTMKAGTLSATGGTFSSNPTDYVHDEHYKVSKGLDGMYTVGLKDKGDGTGGKTSVVELPAETTKNTTTATIDVADIDANKELSVVGGDVSVTFDQNAAAGIADAAGNSTKLNLTVEKTEPSAEQEKTYDDKLVNTTHEVVVNVTLTAGGKPVFDAAKAGGKATVQVPYQVGLKKADISVYYLNNGKTEKVPFTYDAETGIITMTLEHFSAYLITTATHPSITPVDSKPTYIKGSNKDLGFTTVDLPEKITVKVGDKTLTEGKDYTVSDGKLTLTGAYLETLDYGNYTLKVFDENGNEIAKTSFVKSFAVRPAQQPAQSGNKNSTSTKDDVKSAGTGDMGVALYAVSAVLSLTGSAWIVGKKRSK